MDPISPKTILDLARNFMESRILLTGAELDLFTLLAPGPLSAEEITARIRGDSRAMIILLDALAALDLLVKKEGRYSCPPQVANFLSMNSLSSVLPMVHHMAHLWPRWSRLTGVASGVESSRTDAGPSMEKKKEEMEAFIGAMHNIASSLAPKVVAAVDPGKAKFLLDVGGASGTYTLAFLQAVPRMKATLFDKPEVVEIARQRLGQAGVLDRVTLAGGDFYRDELPSGHDLAFVSAIIHQNSLEQNLDLYGKIHRSLVPGGRIIIRDHIMESDRIRPRERGPYSR